MQKNLYIEWAIAQERRRDLLRDTAQDRLVRQARARREPRAQASRGAQGRPGIRMLWSKAAT